MKKQNVLAKVRGTYTEVKSVNVEVTAYEMIRSIKSLLVGTYEGNPRYINSDNYICHYEDGLHDWTEVIDNKNPSPKLVEAYDALKILETYFNKYYGEE